jgi:hypothetical protein
MILFALTILQNTPRWVFAVLALLVFLGAQALRAREVAPWRLAITPAVFIGWGMVALALRPAASALLPLDWLAAAIVGGLVGWTTMRVGAGDFDRERGVVRLPGSLIPLSRNLSIFIAKYGLAVAAALAPARRDQLVLWDIAISGLSAGYFLGWLARLVVKYRQSPLAGVPTIGEARPPA